MKVEINVMGYSGGWISWYWFWVDKQCENGMAVALACVWNVKCESSMTSLEPISQSLDHGYCPTIADWVDFFCRISRVADAWGTLWIWSAPGHFGLLHPSGTIPVPCLLYVCACIMCLWWLAVFDIRASHLSVCHSVEKRQRGCNSHYDVDWTVLAGAGDATVLKTVLVCFCRCWRQVPMMQLLWRCGSNSAIWHTLHGPFTDRGP